MKKNIIIPKLLNSYWKLFNSGSLFVFMFLFLFTSCEDALIEQPKSVAVETFYNTPAEVETAVNAAYSPLRLAYYTIGVNSAHTDYAYGRGSWAALNDFQGLNSVWITRISEVWNYYYLSIRNANIVIANAPKGNAISQADVDKYVAEAKFLRAFTYFQLVRHWGGVPIRTETNLTDIQAKRNSIDEVYNLILSDLMEAEAKLPDVPKLSGKPSKWAAKTLLADVFLQLNKFQEARDKAKEVIQSNKYALVAVTKTDDFQKIFGPDVITNSEEIFYLKFSHEPGQGDTWPWLLNHPGTKLHGGGGVYGVHSDSNNLVYKNWDDNDLRKGQWYLWNIGIGPTSLLSKKLIDPAALSGTASGNPQTWYRYADLLLIYAEASYRVANGTTSEAMEALNQVHRRAYGYNPTIPSSVDFKTADYIGASFLDLIIKERGYEFQLEGKRWLELKRTGKLVETILAVKGKVVTETDYLWPIPTNELSSNKALDPSKDQNPGY
jgi:starch-binding outer membrane protein, SusD/RagB family